MTSQTSFLYMGLSLRTQFVVLAVAGALGASPPCLAQTDEEELLRDPLKDGPAAPAPEEEDVVDPAAADLPSHLLVLLDASRGMDRPARGFQADPRDHRLADFAARALARATEGLAKRSGVHVALRTFGRVSQHRERNCGDSQLEIPLEPVAPRRWQRQLAGLRGRGVPALAHALEAAATDLAEAPRAQRHLIVIATAADGCRADPCGIARRMQKAGAYRRPIVVALDPEARDARALACLGHVETVVEMQKLDAALQSVFARLTERAAFRVEVVRGETFLTPHARVTAYPADVPRRGRVPAAPRIPASETLSLFPGTYDLKVDVAAPEARAIRWVRADVKPGKPANHLLDLTDGTLRVKILKNGEDISEGAQIDVFPHREDEAEPEDDVLTLTGAREGGKLAAAVAAGARVTLLPGRYDVKVKLPADLDYAVKWLRGVEVRPRADTDLPFEVRSGRLRLVVLRDDEDVSRDASASVYRVDGDRGEAGTVEREALCDDAIELRPGRYRVVMRYVDVATEREWVRTLQDLTVDAGGETRHEVRLREADGVSR
jgi:hypothetical protein